MKELMRAARLVEPRRFVIEERPVPRPGQGQVSIRVEGCGLCGSNLPPWRGEAGVSYPMEAGAPGHETYGRVAAVGPGVRGLEPGQPVAALTYHGFADVDLADAQAVVPLPEALVGRPVLGEPMACAVNVAKRTGVQPGDTVVLVGVGFLGALLLPLLARHRPAQVIAVSRRTESLERARAMGADEVVTYDEEPAALVAELTGGELADVVIEATGEQAPLDLAGKLTRVRGRLVIAGYHQDGPRRVDLQLWNWRGLDVINAHERDPAVYRAGMEEAVALAARDELPFDRLITHRVPLEEIASGFETAAERPPGFFKAVVVTGEGA